MHAVAYSCSLLAVRGRGILAEGATRFEEAQSSFRERRPSASQKAVRP